MTSSLSSKKWYAVYTKSRQEKKVAKILQQNNVEYYLPLQKVLKQWSDRKKWQEVPLFSGYIFTYINEKNYFKIVELPGIVGFIKFENKLSDIPIQQIEAIKTYLLDDKRVSLEDNTIYEIGNKIEIVKGPMQGLVGTLIQISGKQRALIEIECVNKQLVINIPKSLFKQV